MGFTAETVRVLHIDDEPDFAEIAAEFLQREDERISVQTATSADSGLRTLQTREIDCVVSDYDMPGKNGIAFLRTVREEYPDLPFILYTGKGSEEVAMDAISAGVTDYLQKETGTDQYTVLANRITNAVESYWSEQKLAERKEDLSRYENMVNSMNDGACIYDDDGRFVVANEYIADLYNTTQEALVGQKSGLVPMIRDRTDDTDPYEALLEGRLDHFSTEVSREFPSTGHLVLDLQLTPLEVDGTIEGIVGVSRDITKLKEHEQQLQEERDRLDEFAGVVSHDLQNILTVAKGRMEIVESDCDSGEIASIMTALDRMDRITEDVLWLAREGRDIGTKDAIVLGEAIDDTWTVVTDQATGAELHYADETASTATIEADGDRFRQLLENVFNNAIDHNGEDITITVGILDNGFYIEDDGCGIPKDHREDVFTAGYSTADHGTGFGLSIVKQIVKAHDWEIHIAEGTEGGARFEITAVGFVAE